MTLFRNTRWFMIVAAMLVAALTAGCADELEVVPRDGTTLSDRADSGTVDDSGDGNVAKTDGSIKDAALIDASDVVVDVITPPMDVMADVNVADRVDVVADRVDSGTSDVPRDVTDAGDNGAPCPPDRTTTCGSRCVNVQTDMANCGACFAACAPAHASAACVAGRCTVASCDMGFRDCDGNADNGCEINTQTDAANCGACASRCMEPRPLCSSGACIGTCPTGMIRCGDSCINTQTDVANCGGCGNVCGGAPANAMPTCVGGMCGGFTCNENFHLCGGACASNNSPATCGSSCAPCVPPPNASSDCDGMACTFRCSPNFADCDGVAANGCETDLRTSSPNCGRCGGTCPMGIACVAGACTDVRVALSTGARMGVESYGAVGSSDWQVWRDTLAPDVFSATDFAIGISRGLEGMRIVYPMSRTGLVYGLPAARRIVAATLETVGNAGVGFIDSLGEMVELVEFAPSSPTVIVASDYALSHWRMSSSFGSNPAVNWQGGATVRMTLNSQGLVYLNTVLGSQAGLGLVTSRDRGGTMPPSAGGSTLVPLLRARTALIITYEP